MDQGRIDTLQGVYAAWARSDFSVGLDMLAPDVLFEPTVERTQLRGAEEIVAYMTEFLTQWSEYRVEAEEFTEVDEATVVVTERQHATGAASGIETVETFYAIWRFGAEGVLGIRWETDRDTAFELAGRQ